MISRRTLKPILGAAAVAGIVLGRGFFEGLYDSLKCLPLQEDLTNAVGAVRPVEGRLAGLDYCSYRHPFIVANPVRRQLESIGRRAMMESTANCPETRRVRVLSALLLDKIQIAAAEMKSATVVQPSNPLLFSDLAAILLERGSHEAKPEYTFLALEDLERALKLAPLLHEPRFNKALVLEKLFLNVQASAAWAVYLRLDNDSPWADEARRRLHALESETLDAEWRRARNTLASAAIRNDEATVLRLAKKFPYLARLQAEEDLLVGWATAKSEGRRADAVRFLCVARSIGEALYKIHSDRLLKDSISIIDHAETNHNSHDLMTLVGGHRAYGEGLRLAEAQEDRKALRQFQHSFALLSLANSPFRGWPLVQAQFSNLYLGEYPEANSLYRRLRRSFHSSRYPSLLGMADRAAGITQFRLGNLAASLSLYNEARSLFTRTNELENLAAVHYSIAENLRFQGEPREAWWYRREALRMSSRTGRYVHLHNALFDSAEAALKQKKPKIAILYQNEMVRLAVSRRDVLGAVEAQLRRSRAFAAAGMIAAAAQDIKNAEQWLKLVTPGQRHDQLAAEINIAKGDVELNSSPQAAAESFGRALAFFATRDDKFRLPVLYERRAHAFEACGERELAEADLRAGIASYEMQILSVREPQLRASFTDQAKPLFDAMISNQVAKPGGNEIALDYAERSHARSFLDLMAIGSHSKTLAPSEIQRRLPDRVALVEFASLPDRLLAWTLTRERISLTTIPLSQVTLKELVLRLRHSLWEEDSKDRIRLSRLLYQYLVKPLAVKEEGIEAVIIVPDQYLYLLPFSVLINPLTGDYFVEERAIGYSPSSTIYLRALQRQRLRISSATPTIALVGDPAFNRSVFPGLSALDGSQREVRSIADMYTSAGARVTLIQGAQATKREVLHAMDSYDVIHLSAHAIINPDYPLLSLLVLAPGQGTERSFESGAVYAHDLYRLRLKTARMAILATCDSGVGSSGGSEGLASLARPFLAAGVSTVVGTLWKINDNEAEAVFYRFHQHLLNGMAPLTALRATQLELLKGSSYKLRSPRVWGGLQLMGASSI